MELWVKAAHIISVISWMAMLLYLPRLFVYHCDAEVGGQQSETFKLMEQRLIKVIGTPAMILTWFFGLWTASLFEVWGDLWFIIKFFLVIALTVIHFLCAGYARAFREDRNEKPQRFFRIINEVPAVIMIIVVILVVVKPI